MRKVGGKRRKVGENFAGGDSFIRLPQWEKRASPP